MKSIHRAWLICLGVTLLLFCTIGLPSSTFTIYQAYLISDGGLTNTQASTVVLIRNLSAMVSMLGVTGYYRRFSLRIGETLTMLAAAAGFFVYGFSNSFFSYCMGSVLTGIAYGLGAMIPASLMLRRWFVQKQGLALGICSSGSGLALILGSPLITAAVNTFSLRTAFLLEGLAIVALAAVVFLLVRDQPADLGLQPLGADAPQPATASAPALGNAALSRGDTALMVLSILLLGGVGNPGFSHLTVLFRTSGFTSTAAATLISLAGISLTVSKCAFGQITDRIGARRSNCLGFGLLFISELLCTFCPSLRGAAIAAMILQGMGQPISTVAISVWARDLSDSAGYAATLRRFQLSYTTGSLLFSAFPGMLADLSGSYQPAYAVFSIFLVGSFVLVELAYTRHLTPQVAA